jgi:hypothetical protein
MKGIVFLRTAKSKKSALAEVLYAYIDLNHEHKSF